MGPAFGSSVRCRPNCLPLPEPEPWPRPATAENPALIPDTLSCDLLLTQFYATVLSPGFFASASHSSFLFAVGDQLQLSGRNALQNQVALNNGCTTLTQSHVVLTSTTLIGVAFQHYAVTLRLEILGVYVQGAHGFGLQ